MDLAPFYSTDIQKCETERERDRQRQTLIRSPHGTHMNDPIKKRVSGPAKKQVEKYFGTQNQVCSNLTAIETLPGRMPCHVRNTDNGHDNSRYI